MYHLSFLALVRAGWPWLATFTPVSSAARAASLYSVHPLSSLPVLVVASAVAESHDPQMNGVSGSPQHAPAASLGLSRGSV